ncbi:MAG: hypothetical protein SGJ18_08755 [Pseudomonadota bacterium]|nr:hypothetical protein [Pseudomonadota bacterium]
MKKVIIVAFVSLTAMSAFAADRKVLCVERNIQDAFYSADFNLMTPKVDLFIPSGETSGNIVSGECRRDEGAIELSLTCNVMTSSDSGYEVRLFSTGGRSLHSTVTPWSMAGKGETISLSCRR